jgi:hypothetical protein
MNASNTKLKKNCNNNWEHYFNVNANQIRVCKGFLLNLYQINKVIEELFDKKETKIS